MCPHNTPKGTCPPRTARGTDRAVSSRPSPYRPPELTAGLSHRVTVNFGSPTDGGTEPLFATGWGQTCPTVVSLGAAPPSAATFGVQKGAKRCPGVTLCPHTAAPHHPDHPGAHGGAARGRHRLGQQGEIQQEERAGGEDGGGGRRGDGGHPTGSPLTPTAATPPQLRTREGSEFLIQHDSEQIVSTWQRAIADSIAQMVCDKGRPHCPPPLPHIPTPPLTPLPPRAPMSPPRRTPRAGRSLARGRSWAVRTGGQRVGATTPCRPDAPTGDAPHPIPTGG